MSERTDKLIEIVKYISAHQCIVAKMLIHIGCRADLYDGFICECFNELKNLKVPNFEEVDK